MDAVRKVDILRSVLDTVASFSSFVESADEIDPNVPLKDYLDSVDMVTALWEIENKYNIQFTQEQTEKIKTCSDVVEALVVNT